MRSMRFVWALLAFASQGAAAQTHTVTQVTPDLSSFTHVSAVVVHPLDAQRLLAGFSAPQWNGPGALRASNDGGRTWNAPVGVPSDLRSVERMHAHAGRPGVVFIKEGSGKVDQGGFFPHTSIWTGRTLRSDDFGLTWAVVYTPSSTEFSIAPFGSDPLDVNRILGTRRTGFDCGLNCFYPSLGGDVTVVESLDGGRTWATGRGLPARGNPGLRPMNGTAGAPTPLPPGRMYFSNGESVFMSRDAGHTWGPVDVRWPGRLLWMRQDPRRLPVLYALAEIAGEAMGGPARLYRSEDDGATWNLMLEFAKSFTDTAAAVVPTLTIDPVHTNSLWLTGVEGGLLHSADSGNNWSVVGSFTSSATVAPQFDENRNLHVNPLERGLVTGVVLNSSEPGVAYVLWRDNLFRLESTAKPDPIIVEFQYEGDRYWLTSLDGEALSQDYRVNPLGILRTGQRFGVWRADNAPAGALGSCRFWPKPETGLRTRVLMLRDGECEILRRDPGWILEAENEFFAMPSSDGDCQGGLVPVRRFNNLEADANRRWVVDAAVADEMSALGWYDEGVRMCARPLGSNE
jgi:photosystem II stability/assembly factor-like uncharacterized protein